MGPQKHGVSNGHAIVHIIAQKGDTVHAYIDDFFAISPVEASEQAYLNLSDLIEGLGLPINDQKRNPPTTDQTCSGINIDIEY